MVRRRASAVSNHEAPVRHLASSFETLASQAPQDEELDRAYALTDSVEAAEAASACASRWIIRSMKL